MSQGRGNHAIGPGWRLAGALVIALTVKAVLLAAGVVPFNADEAVVALMARHILQGARPVFFYGQAYLGSLDAWLVAGAFGLLGESVLAIRLVQTGLYLGTLATTYLLGLRIYGSHWIAGTAAVFLAVPTVLVSLYTTASLGGYGETLLIGNGLFLLALSIGHARTAPHTSVPVYSAAWLSFGLLAGFGFWAFPLIVVYVIPALAYALIGYVRRRPEQNALRRGLPALGLWLAGFALGAAPWIWFTLNHGLAAITETGGSAIAGASSPNLVLAAFAHLFNFLLFGLTVIVGLRPPWSAQFLALPLAPFILAVYSALVVFNLRRAAYARQMPRPGRWLLLGLVAALVALFILTPFGADPSGRYFLPLAPALALLLAEMLYVLKRRARRKWLPHALALGVIGFNAWGTAQGAAAFPPGLTTQFDAVAQVDQRDVPALMAFLRAQGETRGYANYWVEFPLAFLSGEELIYDARLPYHLDLRYTRRDSRYPPYSSLVAGSPKVAYITTRHPPLDELLRTRLAEAGVTFQETQLGDFHVFYSLSRAVRPEELGLGVDCCQK